MRFINQLCYILTHLSSILKNTFHICLFYKGPICNKCYTNLLLVGRPDHPILCICFVQLKTVNKYFRTFDILLQTLSRHENCGLGFRRCNFDWFLNNCDINLVIQASEIEIKRFVGLLQNLGYFSFCLAKKLRS